MNSQPHSSTHSDKGNLVDTLEETIMAYFLGIMTVLTFVNVIRRYVFNASLIWSLEVVLTLFAWMVLIGISYGIKKTTHLGVDAVTNLLPRSPRHWLAVLSGVLCILYAVMMLKGAWDYWAPFAGLDVTSGRWFPTGFVETRSRAFMETDQVPMPFFLNFLADLINDGDAYGKLPDVVPYIMLPIGCALILIRFIQATIRIIRWQTDTLIVSHEAVDAVDQAAETLAKSERT